MEFADVFKAIHQALGRSLTVADKPETMIGRVATHAFELFESNIELQIEELPELACRKNCPSCCILRVTATAPEVFLLARYIRLIEGTANGAQIGLPKRIAETSAITNGLDEQQRMALRQPCPMMFKGVCIVHPVRPLACRGHASFDRAACARAAKGLDVDVPVSEPHRNLRFLVQSALQSTLYKAGLPYGLYELNSALSVTLSDEEIPAAWTRGEDRLGSTNADGDLTEMAAAFDALLDS